MRPQPLPSRPDPVAAAVADVLDATADDFTRADREMMAWTEGVLTATAIGPERTRPSEWARAVFGSARRFDDAAQAQAQAAIAMLTLLYNSILTDLRRQGPDYTPFFLDHAAEEEGAGLGAAWAAGFAAGTQLRPGTWRSLLDSPQGRLSFAPILALLLDDSGNSLYLEGDAEQVAAARKDALDWLGTAVHEISEYWGVQARREQRGKIDPFPKTGRNEPCPCGSGKKYKKCCLDA
jgi:uncharacterized protein